MENSRVADQLPRLAVELRRDALRIWQAGLEAVRPERLVPEWLRVEGRTLVIGNQVDAASCRVSVALPLDSIRRIAVVGGGKAGAGMATAVETALGPDLMAEKQLTGWLNVPADGAGCQPAPRRIHLHPARPAGVNEPTPAGVAGALEILRLVASLGPDDLCLCLISGGGSALMPAPAEGISLADKLAVTRCLSAAGANIGQINTVRKQLSRLKGGGLLRACRAGRLVALIISDVLGDPLEMIASGPTVHDSSTPQAALDVLEQFGARQAGISPTVFDYLVMKNSRGLTAPGASRECHAINLVIGNNATAVEAAGKEALRLGYATTTESEAQSEGPAEDVGRQLAERALEMRAAAGLTSNRVPLLGTSSASPPTDVKHCLFQAVAQATGPTCLVSGGEPVVTLVEPSRRGLGGRNQQLALAALLRLADDGVEGIALLSAGTDGEDGPTDAAGAFCDADVLAATRRAGFDPSGYLARNDAYHFFAPLGALLKTGSTGTNVCDVRVLVVDGAK